MASREGQADVEELSALADPVRRALYRFVAGQGEPVRRDTAAESAGISRTLAAYHLDRLVDAGLLVASYARPEGQTGPGAGRPAKLYEPTRAEVAVSVPPRDYAVLARLLAEAVESDASGHVEAALRTAAEREGREAADRAVAQGQDLLDTLRSRGYDPELDEDQIALRNCPFHQLAKRHVDLVCGLNHALLRGLLEGRGEDPECARLAPQPGYCCVRLSRPSTGSPRKLVE